MSKSDITPSAMKRPRPTESDPWEPAVPEGEHMPLKGVIEQAIGSASMCWVGGTGDLEYDSARAAWVADGLGLQVEKALEEAEARGYARACHERPGHYCGRCSIPFDSADEALAHVAEKHPTVEQATTHALLAELRKRYSDAVELRTFSSSLTIAELHSGRGNAS